jgi:membrane protease subunit HflK
LARLQSQAERHVRQKGGGGNNGGGEMVRACRKSISIPNSSGAVSVCCSAWWLPVVWLASGFYIVDASQRGLVLQFGSFKETTEPGLRWRLPYRSSRTNWSI